MRSARYGYLVLLLGCAANPLQVAHSAATASPSAPQAIPSAPEPSTGEKVPPERAVHEADGPYRDQLAVPGRDDRFSADRQIAVLERAIALYKQFLERAGDDPHYEEAAHRSRDRIADAKRTIDFLRATGQ